MLSFGDIAILVVEAGLVGGVGWYVWHRFWPKGAPVSVTNVEVAATTAAMALGVSNVSTLESTVITAVKNELASLETIINSFDLRLKLVESEIMNKAKTFISDVEVKAEAIEKDVVADVKEGVSIVETDAKKIETAVVNEAEKIATDVKDLAAKV